MDYFRAIQRAGGAQIKKEVDTPDFRLGVGKAEVLHNIPIKVTYSAGNNRAVVPDESSLAYEKTAYNGVGDGVTDSMFDGGGDAIGIWEAIEAGRAHNGY